MSGSNLVELKRIVQGTLLATVLFHAPASFATHYYVSTSGSDSNICSQTAPCASIQNAVNKTAPGDTVHVAPGNYSDYHSACGNYPMVCITKSGTASAPITILSDTKWGAKLSCNPNSSGMLFEIMASYIVISGFDMTCPGTVGSYNYAAGISGNNGYVTFSNNYAHDFSVQSCPSVGVFTDDGIGHNTWDGNVIRRAGSGATCDQIHGIYMGLPYDVAINNVISGIAGLGIHAYGGGVCHQVIANNTVFDNSQGGILVEDDVIYHPDLCGSKGITDYQTIINNISFNNGFVDKNGAKGGWSGVNVYGSSGVGTHNIVANNIVFGNSVNSNYPSQCTISGGSCSNTMSGVTSSMFVNYLADKNWAPLASFNYQNYSLISGSSAIDAGVSASSPYHDINLNLRPQGNGVDVGAFEFASSISPTPPPVPTPVAAISAPTNLIAKSPRRRRISLSWTNSAGSSAKIAVERSTDGVKFSQITTLPEGTSSYLNSGLNSRAVYYYRLRSFTDSGQYSPYSNIASAQSR